MKTAFLEAQMSQTQNTTFSFFDISPLFVDRFGLSLRFCHQEFYKEAISDGCRRKNARYRCGGGGCILSDFGALNFCGPSGPCFFIPINIWFKNTWQKVLKTNQILYKSKEATLWLEYACMSVCQTICTETKSSSPYSQFPHLKANLSKN